MRYEFILNRAISKDWKVMPSIGFGGNPFFNRNSSIPKIATSYPTTEKLTGIRGFVIPRVTYFIAPKLFLDLNLPINMMEFGVINTNRPDSMLPIEETNATTTDLRLLPRQFSARIGIGLKL